MNKPKESPAWPQAHLVQNRAGTLCVDPRELFDCQNVPVWAQDPRSGPRYGMLAVNTLTYMFGSGTLSPSSGGLYSGGLLATTTGVSTWTIREWSKDPDSPVKRLASGNGRGAHCIYYAEERALLDYKADRVDRRYESRVKNSPYKKKK